MGGEESQSPCMGQGREDILEEEEGELGSPGAHAVQADTPHRELLSNYSL